MALTQIQKEQELIAKRLKQILVPEDEERALGVANQKLSQAIENFVPDKLLEIRELQRVADEKMRHYIVEQSIILETAAPVAAPSEGDGDSSSSIVLVFLPGEGLPGVFFLRPIFSWRAQP